LNASHIKAVISGTLRKLLFSAQASLGEEKALTLYKCAMHSKMPKENFSLHD